MTWHEKIFGDVMLGVIAGLFLWAISASFISMYLGDAFFLGHHGGRAGDAAYVDYPY